MNAAELYPIGGGECEVELDVPAGYPNDGTRPSNVPSGLYWDSDGICVYVWGPCDKLEELYGDTVDGHNPAPPEDGNGNDGSPGTPENPDGDDPDDTLDDPGPEEPEKIHVASLIATMSQGRITPMEVGRPLCGMSRENISGAPEMET
ncbi:MAG: hypothetical protein M2R46_03224 [Verrucomicrobia subdivision 3 bacterium]|nr:hypothetical protein [Limisphaerales bacterium]